MRFDIRLFYPSVNHQILLKKTPEIYEKLTRKTVSRRFKKKLKKDIPEFLFQSPYGKGLSIGSPLSYSLSGIFLLDLDLELINPFLRQTDDYLIFCKSKKEPEKILREIIYPKLQELQLEINEGKLVSGKFHQDKVNFIGFEFYAGYFTAREKKKEEFKKKIIKLTRLTRKKSEKIIIKSLNNQILGFGHYYKIADCRQVFERLDGFCRMRLRRWLLNQKELIAKEGNLILTNEAIKKMGLKSLSKIKERFNAINKPKKQVCRLSKSTAKTGQKVQKAKSSNWIELENLEVKYQLRLILKKLNELTSLIAKVENRVVKIEQKLDKLYTQLTDCGLTN